MINDASNGNGNGAAEPTRPSRYRKGKLPKHMQRQIERGRVEKLAEYGCGIVEMAYILDVERHVLHDPYYVAAIDKGRSIRALNLRKRLYEEALNGNIAALIFLAKSELGMTEVQEVRIVNESIAPEPQQKPD